MKIRKWSEEEFSFIRGNPNLSYKQLARKLGRSELAVKQVVWKAKGSLRKTTAWIDEEINFLKENYNLSYDELIRKTGRTKRALKHKIGELGLKRDERRRVSDEEKDFIKQHSAEWSKDLAKSIGRSEFAVARLKREVLGSANPRFKEGWNELSCDLAYFLGAVCSDMGVYKYNVCITQKLSNGEMICEVKRIFEELFGFKPYERINNIDGMDYRVIGVCSSEFLKNFGTESSIKKGNLKFNGEWVDFLLEKFSWVFEDSYFWHFIGGLYDGDGSLIRKTRPQGIWYEISLAIKPERSRLKIMDEMKKRGFIFTPRSWDEKGIVCDIGLKGGQEAVDKFLEVVQCRIQRKKKKCVVA